MPKQLSPVDEFFIRKFEKDATPNEKRIAEQIYFCVDKWIEELINASRCRPDEEFYPYFLLGSIGHTNSERIFDAIKATTIKTIMNGPDDNSRTLNLIDSDQWNNVVSVLSGAHIDNIGVIDFIKTNNHRMIFSIGREGSTFEATVNYVTAKYNVKVISMTVSPDDFCVKAVDPRMFFDFHCGIYKQFSLDEFIKSGKRHFRGSIFGLWKYFNIQ